MFNGGILVGIWWTILASTAFGQVINTTDCGDGVANTWSSWMAFSELSACSVSCNGETGEQSRQRSRTCPVPVMMCDAEQFQVQYIECMGSNTPVDGGYGQWSEWADDGECSVICGHGFVKQSRSRQCDSPEPSCGGSDCRLLGPDTQSRDYRCHPRYCPAGSCSRYSPVSVLSSYRSDDTYLLCYRGSIYTRPCPRAHDTRAYYVYGKYNALAIYRVCSRW